MNLSNLPGQNEELTRLEILRAFKERFAGDGTANHSPFSEDRVVRYDTDVSQLDVVAIHQHVRDAVRENIRRIHRGEQSRVVILAGNPGMGKSHLINYFRMPQVADDEHYILVCNSNHWKVQEFEECLLDWILEALVRPSPYGPHLLLQKIEDLAFQALSQILVRPQLLRKFLGRKDAGYWRRLWVRLTGKQFGRFQRALENRDATIFRRLDFHHFTSYVCDRFLDQPGNPFHRYVLQVLMRYLFAEDREKVLHWLRRKKVHDHFFAKLDAEECIDRKFKVIDTIKILISLFSPDVAKNLSSSENDKHGRAFFFAFDQIEGRDELFEQESDWLKFFAQLSELYNALPNVFVLFTMTTDLRDKLFPKMERQFRERIHRDQKYVLRMLTNDEILAIYRRRIENWLGSSTTELGRQLEDSKYRYLPFDANQIVQCWGMQTLREALGDLDKRFCKYLDEEVVGSDPRFEFLVVRNELRQTQEDSSSFHYTESHLATVTELLNRAGGLFAKAYGLNYTGLTESPTEDGLPALRLEFKNPEHDERWVRVFLTRLPFQYNARLPGCIELLKNLNRERYFLWLVRPERADLAWESERAGQTFARVLPPSTETALRAMLKLLDKRGHLEETWRAAETVLLSEFKLTYLGELFQNVSEILETARTLTPESEKSPVLAAVAATELSNT